MLATVMRTPVLMGPPPDFAGLNRERTASL